MSSHPLLKKFKLLALGFLCLSCAKTRDSDVVIKAGERAWTFKETQDYFQFRLSRSFPSAQKPALLKKEILNEILLISLVENWAKKTQTPGKKASLTKGEKQRFSANSRFAQALKDHKNHTSLYRLLLEDFFKKTPDPPLKEQRAFYSQNRASFSAPPSCRLKQILVNQENLAQTLLRRLKRGESFNELSRLYSLKKSPGWVKKGDLDVFDQACRRAKNSLSPVLKSPYGWHIFLVEEKELGRKKPFKSAQKQIIQILKGGKAKEQFQIWLKRETLKTPVWTNQGLLDKIRIQYKAKEI